MHAGVYLGALLTEWFQAAYLFVLLRFYYAERIVVRIYLAGVVSQLFLSVVLEIMGGFVPQKWRCAACLILQAASAVLLLHPAFGGLVTSRVLAGFACALLHSSFEAWMVEQVWMLYAFVFCLFVFPRVSLWRVYLSPEASSALVPRQQSVTGTYTKLCVVLPGCSGRVSYSTRFKLKVVFYLPRIPWMVS